MPEASVQSRFGDTVKLKRRGLGITQEELAGRSGLHRTYISDIERGARNVTLESIERLSAALETSLQDLFAPRTDVLAGGQNLSLHCCNGAHPEILLVEDDPRDVELTLQSLKRVRMTNPVHVVRDGEAALDFLLGKGRPPVKGPSGEPGVILLDLQLPKINGVEVLRRVKSDPRARKIPVVVLTVSQRSRDIMECQALGVEAYLVKPFGFAEFSRITPKLGLQWALVNPASRAGS